MSSYQSPSRPSRPDSPGRDPNAITFSVGGSVGVQSRDILQGCTLIDRSHDDVLPELTAGGSLMLQASVFIYDQLLSDVVVTCRQWPGYFSRAADTSRRARIVILDDEPFTRQELAREICGHISRFQKIAYVCTPSFHFCTFGLISPPQKTKIKPGWEHYALGENATDIMLYSVTCRGNTLIPHFRLIDRGGIERHIAPNHRFASNIIKTRHNRRQIFAH